MIISVKWTSERRRLCVNRIVYLCLCVRRWSAGV